MRFLQAKIQNNIVESPFEEATLEEKSIGEVLFTSLLKDPENVCIICSETGRSLANKEIYDMSRKFGSCLVRKGFKVGDTLCISSSNVPEYVVAILGAIAVGGKIATSSPAYTVDELSRQLKETKPKFLICEEMTYSVCAKAAEDTNIQEIFTFDKHGEVKCLAELIESEDGSLFKLHQHEDLKNSVAAILYSSGTTGAPKGTMLTHYNIVSNLLQINTNGQVRVTKGNTYFGLLPFFHSYGLFVVLLNCVYNSSRIVCYRNFMPTSFLEAITKFKVTHLNVVPYLTIFLAKHPEVLKYDLSHVKSLINAAAALDATPPTLNALKKRLPNALITQGFGMTELAPVAHNHPELGCEDINSVGYPVSRTQCKVIDIKTGETLSEGKKGELLVKGPQVMKGYLHNEEATAKTINSDGWLHTGDVAYWDNEGKFFIVDRIKELIKYKGLQVSPTELEKCLGGHPAIQDVGVVGIPDESRGELPAAAITLKPGYEEKVIEEEIHNYMAEKLSSHKQLHGGIKFVKLIPRGTTGKLNRKEILACFK
ncbi:putative 4-coumarate--CoA ligase 1 [Nymphon striatum]|nr:putative 4-coumarate--CoA ligase 1 [Nymphon striatum]